MQTLSVPALPEDLDRARREFERWRRGRPRGARIPNSLWQMAVGLAKSHGVNRTSLWLRLDYYCLQRRLSLTPMAAAASSPPEPKFVEVVLPSSASSPSCRVELLDPRGATVRVDLSGLSATDLATFVRTVCRSEP